MILLDTHVLVWAASRDRKLGKQARRRIEAAWADAAVGASALSFWEIGMLQARGRLKAALPLHAWRTQLLEAGLAELPLDGETAVRASDLSGLPDDPVDRFLVATALVHRAELVTADDRLLAWPHRLVRHDARD